MLLSCELAVLLSLCGALSECLRLEVSYKLTAPHMLARLPAWVMGRSESAGGTAHEMSSNSACCDDDVRVASLSLVQLAHCPIEEKKGGPLSLLSPQGNGSAARVCPHATAERTCAVGQRQ
eukprot:354984-Chlamydomonas_euryale.AAC.2